MLRYSVTRPTPAQVLRRTRVRRSTSTAPAGSRPARAPLRRSALLGGADAKVLLDGRPSRCRRRSKKASLTCAQPPRSSIVKRLGRRGELVRAGDAVDDRPVALGRRRSPAPPACRGSRRTPWPASEDAASLVTASGFSMRIVSVRDDVVDVLAGLLRGDRLVLVGEQHVALAADERLQRLARALVLHRHVVEEVLEVGLGLVLGLALLQLRAVGGHDVPLGAAGGERVRLDDLDAGLGQVGPAG